MKPQALLFLAAMAAMPPGVAWTADATANKPTDRVVVAEREFGDVRFVIGGGAARKWLEMYVGGDFVGAFQDILADDVIASPDRKHFLALSNSSKSALAFAVLDRKGNVVASGPHGGNLHYCNRTSWGIAEWVDTGKPQATFSTQLNQMTSPATEFLSVTVRGCDGTTVIVARPSPPTKLAAPAVSNRGITNADVAGDPLQVARSTFFIGNTIANLRGMDPTFGGRTLTLVEGRRVVASTPQTTKALSMPVTWTAAQVSERRSCNAGLAACGQNAVELLLSRPDGSTQVFASGLVGEFIALPTSSRIFACSWNVSAGEQNNPVVVDLTGERTTLPAHPGPVLTCARTGSGDEVLLVYTMAQTGLSFTLARVFDAGGALLAEKTFEAAGTVEFTVAGKPYAATVPGP